MHIKGVHTPNELDFSRKHKNLSAIYMPETVWNPTSPLTANQTAP